MPNIFNKITENKNYSQKQSEQIPNQPLKFEGYESINENENLDSPPNPLNQEIRDSTMSEKTTNKIGEIIDRLNDFENNTMSDSISSEAISPTLELSKISVTPEVKNLDVKLNTVEINNAELVVDKPNKEILVKESLGTNKIEDEQLDIKTIEDVQLVKEKLEKEPLLKATTDNNSKSENVPSELNTDPLAKENKAKRSLLNLIPNKLKLGIVGVLLSLILISFGLFMLYSNISVPEINITSSLDSSKEVILSSTNKPFFVKLKGNVIYSQYLDGLNIIRLGKEEGKIELSAGGLYSLGPVKIEGNNSKKIETYRDATAIKLSKQPAKYYETKKTKIEFVLEAEEEGFSVNINNEKAFESAKQDNKDARCVVNNKKFVSCDYNFEDKTTDLIKIDITDMAGNKSDTINQQIELVQASTIKCDTSKIRNEGILQCNPNYTGSLKFKDKEIQVKKDIEFKIDESLGDGQQKIEYTITTDKGISKTITEDITVDKQILDIQINSLIDDKNATTSKPLIILQVIPTTDASLSYSGSYTENKESKIKKFINSSSNINSTYTKNEKGILLSETYDESKGDSSILKLKFSNQAGRTVNYNCTRNFNEKEYKCVKL